MVLYVVADIHAYYGLFLASLKEAGFFDEPDAKLILLGDALDRGEGPVETVDFLLSLHREGRLIYIRGNHEDLIDRCLDDIAKGYAFEIASGMSYHYRNGTFDTLLALAGMTDTEAVKDPEGLIQRVKASAYYSELLPTCLDYFETDEYIFTHGWLPCYPIGEKKPYLGYMADENWRNADKRRWEAARWFNGMELACQHGILEEGKVVVCGHFRTSWGHCQIHKEGGDRDESAIYTPFCDRGIIALDGCITRSGLVNCLRLEV